MSVRSVPSNNRRQITLVVDGGGVDITTGVKGFVSMPCAGVWRQWTILSIDDAVTSGSIVFDVWVDDLAAYPPTVADTITAAAKPTVSTATFATGSTLTGWTTGFNAGDVVGFNVDSITDFLKVALILEFD